MALDRHREIDLWITASQVTDTDPSNRDQTRVSVTTTFRQFDQLQCNRTAASARD